MSEVNDVSPTSLAHLIGQKGVVAQVQVALEAAWADNRKFDSGLLVGAPGLGKSQLASVIAAEMASDLHEVLGQSITSPADLNALLLSAKNKDIIHQDECRKNGIVVAQIPSADEQNWVFTIDWLTPHIEQEEATASVKSEGE